MSHLSEDEQEISLLKCGCTEDCNNLSMAFRNPVIEPHPNHPETLMCRVRLPLIAIPGLVAALMDHYAKSVEGVEE